MKKRPFVRETPVADLISEETKLSLGYTRDRERILRQIKREILIKEIMRHNRR